MIHVLDTARLYDAPYHDDITNCGVGVAMVVAMAITIAIPAYDMRKRAATKHVGGGQPKNTITGGEK